MPTLEFDAYQSVVAPHDATAPHGAESVEADAEGVHVGCVSIDLDAGTVGGDVSYCTIVQQW